MKITVKLKHGVLRYASALCLVGLMGLAGCAPVSPYPAPGQQGQRYIPPAAMPLQKRPARPAQQQTYVPPALSPVPEQRRQVAITRPPPVSYPQSRKKKPVRSKQPEERAVQVPKPVQKTTEVPASRSSRPDVAYIPDKPAKADDNARSASKTPSAPTASVTVTTKPYWKEEGKVEVEVVDLKKDTAPDTTRSNSSTADSGNDTAAATSSSNSSSSSPAVAVLMKQANNELVAGKADRAATTLERALRIAPNDPNLWLRLAEVNAQQGNKSQAASMAKKAISLSPDDDALRRRGQRLLN